MVCVCVRAAERRLRHRIQAALPLFPSCKAAVKRDAKKDDAAKAKQAAKEKQAAATEEGEEAKEGATHHATAVAMQAMQIEKANAKMATQHAAGRGAVASNKPNEGKKRGAETMTDQVVKASIVKPSKKAARKGEKEKQLPIAIARTKTQSSR